MKIKLQLFCVSMLAYWCLSCSNDVEMFGSFENTSQSRSIVLDFTKSVSDFDKLKSELMKSTKLKLITPSFERILSNVIKDENIVSDESVFFKTSNDSISIMLTKEYITVISKITPEPEYYLLHASDQYIEEYARSLSTQTKSVNSLIAKQISGNGFMMRGLRSNEDIEDMVFDESNSIVEAAKPTLTKGEWPDRSLDVVRIWLIRHSGFSSMQHEVGWQQQHVITMMKSVNWHVKVEFYTRHSDFHVTNNGYETLNRFKDWLGANIKKGHEWSGSVGKDIFVLISHGGYDNISGRAFVDVYKKSRKYNPMAIGISAINPITADMTLAHEIGHILGAVHTDYAWWEPWKAWPLFGIWKRDVMSSGDNFIIRSAECKDPNNVRKVRQSLW